VLLGKNRGGAILGSYPDLSVPFSQELNTVFLIIFFEISGDRKNRFYADYFFKAIARQSVILQILLLGFDSTLHPGGKSVFLSAPAMPQLPEIGV
jgi:hypothetical protein